MEKFQLTCPYCKATLEAEDGIDQFFCSHCGGKILIDGMSKEAYKAKVKVKEMEHTERLKDKEYAQERYKIEKENKSFKTTMLILLLLIIVCFTYLGIDARKYEKQKENAISKLENLESEIEICINEQDYDGALFKANQLYADDIIKDEKETWDKKRKAYIEIIEEARLNADKNDPSKIKIDYSSKQIEGMNYEKAVEKLTENGFLNIIKKESLEESSFFHKENTVEHITINGEKEFTNKDYFSKDSEIILYCYK